MCMCLYYVTAAYRLVTAAYRSVTAAHLLGDRTLAGDSGLP